MAYGEIKVDTITFTDGGIDKSVTISGLVQNPTFSGNITVTGTISGNTVRGQTVSGVTVTGTTAQFTSGTFTTITGGVATITSGVFAAGSAASPSITFTGDLNTGIYSPGADQVAISTNGTRRLIILSDGKVGLGAASVLQQGSGVDGGSAAGVLELYNGSTGNTTLENTGAFPILFKTNGSERLRITSAGLVGVGTSAPSVLLHSVVSSAGVAYRGGHNNTGFDVYVDDSIGEARLVAKRTGGSGGKFMSFYTDTGSGEFERARIDSSGRVGIGTSSPLGNLHIVSSTSTAGWQVRVNGVGLSNESGFYRTASDNYEMVLRNAAGGLSYLTNTGGASSSTLEFVVQGSERARIDSSGRLLVGTSTARSNIFNTSSVASNIFQVEKAQDSAGISIVTNNDTSGTAYLALCRSKGTSIGSNTLVASGDVLGTLTFQGSDGTEFVDGARIEAYVDGTSGANDLPTRLVFSTTADGASSPTERMRITSAGNVGIGVTSPVSKLHVNLGTNENIVFTTGGGGDQRITAFNDAANATVQLSLQGSPLLFRSTGGVEAGRWDSSGRLLVGTSSGSDNNALLKVQGNVGGTTGSGWIDIRRGLTTPGSGGQLGLLSFSDASGNLYAGIEGYTDAATGTNDYPGRLVFSTTADGASSPTERMRITNGGSLLTFNSTNDSHEIRTALAAGTTNNLILGAYGATNNTGGGTAAIAVRTNGNIENANNSYAAFSDAKLKENIVDATSQWNDVKALQVRKYNFKEGQTHTQIGLVAQEVELVSPGLVTESPDRDAEGNDLGTVTKSVNYSVLYMKAVKALQEAMERIETLEAKVAALESA